MTSNLNLLNSRSYEFEVPLRRYLPSKASLSSVQRRVQLPPHQGPQKIEGDILDDPELLWAELDFNEERIAEAQDKLREQASSISSSSMMSSYWKDRYTSKANMYWHEFYKRNSNNFYKDRHYLHVVFPELLEKSTEVPRRDHCLKLCEVGAGVCFSEYLIKNSVSFSHFHWLSSLCSRLEMLCFLYWKSIRTCKSMHLILLAPPSI